MPRDVHRVLRLPTYPRLILAISEYKRRKTAPPSTMSCGMTKVVNLRMARKRAARNEAAQSASENRQEHGVSRVERVRLAVDREISVRKLDQHKIEKGDRR